MRILITGADGFVGSRLVPRLLVEGHEVIAGVRPVASRGRVDPRAEQVAFELGDEGSVRAAAELRPDAVIHLAAVASGGEARKDPSAAWDTNAIGTRRLAQALSGGGPASRLIVVSTAEVYGAGPPVPRVETDPTAPCSSYAESKLGAERAALEVHRQAALPVVIARSFPHTGPGQTERYVVPAFAARLRAAKKVGAPAVRVGNLSPVREFLHVDDVVEAYVLLLQRGQPGEVYNIAAGQGISLEQLFFLLCDLVGHRALPQPDASLMRAADIPYLVGSGAKLRAATGWGPKKSLEETLAEVVRAQAD